MPVPYRRFLLEGLASLMPTPVVVYAARRQLTCFVYHVVSSERLPHVAHLYNYCSPESFEQDLDFIQDNFTIVSYEDIRGCMNNLEALPLNPAAISFDDGMTECYGVVAPILRERNIPCLFFLTKNCIDNKKMLHSHVISLVLFSWAKIEGEGADIAPVCETMSSLAGKTIASRESFESWVRSLGHADRPLLDQVAGVLGVDIAGYLEERKPYLSSEQVSKLAGDGFDFGAHGVTHSDLGKLGDAGIIEEVVASCHWVQNLLGLPGVPFAFPYGGENIRRDLLARLKEEHEAVDSFFVGIDVPCSKEPCSVGRIWAEWPLDCRRRPLSWNFKKKTMRDQFRKTGISTIG